MSIEVEALLERNGAVFLAGEGVSIKVTFRNKHPALRKSLAWGCVQMHCEQNATNKSRTEKEGARRDNNNQSSSSTAFTKSKHAIFSSEPAILFCDLNIDPGGSQTFESTHQIPLLNYPPSFKGYFVKYGWYISVAAQLVDKPIVMVQLPLKVLNVGVDVDVRNSAPIDNPFLRRDTKSPSLIEIAMSRIEELCSVRKKRVYEINSGGTVFARIVLYRNIFKLGNDVIGRLEFPQEDVHCLQILIRAETLETNLLDDQKLENVQIHGTEHLISAFVKETYFKMPLPMTATPSFTTEIVSVKWRIHFEFVTTRQVLMNKTEQGSLKLAKELHIETMKWDLPINVLTCNPLNANLVCTLPFSTSFLI